MGWGLGNGGNDHEMEVEPQMEANPLKLRPKKWRLKNGGNKPQMEVQPQMGAKFQKWRQNFQWRP